MTFLYVWQKGTCKKCVPFVWSAEYNNKLSTGSAENTSSSAENEGDKNFCIAFHHKLACDSIRLITALLVL